MVERVRAGAKLREAAREFHVSLSVIQRWVRYAAGQRLDRVDWTGKTRAGFRPINRTERAVEVLVVTVREQLAKTSDLGEHGAEAIHAALLERGSEKPPSVRTIGRIIERSGALDFSNTLSATSPPRVVAMRSGSNRLHRDVRCRPTPFSISKRIPAARPFSSDVLMIEECFQFSDGPF